MRNGERAWVTKLDNSGKRERESAKATKSLALAVPEPALPVKRSKS
nr:hypothetical protein [Nostoc sp. CHAB 5715]